ncbi:MAG: hypothetical protein AB8G15_16080 [Saprospiraceae bacterium]
MNLKFNKFKAIKDKHRLLLELENLTSKIDFNSYQKKVKETLILNLQDWEKIVPKSEEHPKLDVLLFEYDTTWWKSRQAHVYGIYNWEGYQLSEGLVNLDTPYEIVEQLEHFPSFTLDFYDCFSLLDEDEKVEQVYVLERSGYYDLDGFDELNEYIYLKGCLAIHDALDELNEDGCLGNLNLKNQAMIVIGEHGMEERCLFIV